MLKYRDSDTGYKAWLFWQRPKDQQGIGKKAHLGQTPLQAAMWSVQSHNERMGLRGVLGTRHN